MGVSVGVLVGAVEGFDESQARPNTELIGLSDVTNIQPMLEALLGTCKSFPVQKILRLALQPA